MNRFYKRDVEVKVKKHVKKKNQLRYQTFLV